MYVTCIMMYNGRIYMYMFHVQISTCDLCQRIARNYSLQNQNCFQFLSIHPGITWALILLALFHLLSPPREIVTFLPYVIISQNGYRAVAL